MTDIKFDKKNYRKHNEKNKKLIKKSLQDCGAGRSIIIDSENVLIAGNGVYEQAQALKIPVRIIETDGNELIAVKRTDLKTDDEKRKQLAIMDNSTSDSSEFDLSGLQADFDTEQLGEWGCVMPLEIFGGGEFTDYTEGCLKDKYLVSPYSVLRASAYDWQQRKTAWINQGLHSEVGRKTFTDSLQALYLKRANLTQAQIENSYKAATSIFDPVLCELLYSWFSKEDDKIIDPFAGGSVRGVIASRLGRHYTGLELREEQVNANIDNYNEYFKNDDYEPNWIIGDSNQTLNDLQDETFDMCISCPPYADLEVYSGDPADISNMSYDKFLEIYQSIINKVYAKLKNNTFTAWVVGECRNKTGNYYNFIGDTISCFLKAGFNYYNEIILVTPNGTAAMRASGQFNKSRKVVKVHQNVLLFCKGDGLKTSKKLGIVEVKEITKEDLKTV